MRKSTFVLANGAAITQKRVKSGMTMSEVASRVGVSCAPIMRAERGGSVSPSTAAAICKALNAPFDELFTIRRDCDTQAAAQQ